MTPYESGKRFEYKVIADLNAHGYEVIRAAGSKGATKVDVVAVRPGEALFIQCKRDGALPPGEWDHLLTVALWVDAVPLLAVNGPGGRGVVYIRLEGAKRRKVSLVHQPASPFTLGGPHG